MPESKPLLSQGQKKRQRELFIISVLLIAIPVLLYYASRSLRWNIELSIKHKILVFSLINLNVILLLLLLYLIVRNLVKLFLQRKKNILGARLKSKLVAAFVILTLFPTAILFVVSVLYISTSLEYWFSKQIQTMLTESTHVQQGLIDLLSDDLLEIGNNLAAQLPVYGDQEQEVKNLLSNLTYSNEFTFLFFKGSPNFEIRSTYPINITIPVEEILKALHLDQKNPSQGYKKGYLNLSTFEALYAVITLKAHGSDPYMLLVIRSLPKELMSRAKRLIFSRDEYDQFSNLKFPIKSGHIISLTLVTLLILFSSIWFGIYLSNEITIPIQALAEATRKVANRDYDIQLKVESRDEIGILVDSFNKMAQELKVSNERLEVTNRQLTETNLDLVKQKSYMEFVLNNVGAGVISVDREGIITTFNPSAEKILETEKNQALGRHYEEIIPPEFLNVVNTLVSSRPFKRTGFVKKNQRVYFHKKVYNLLISLSSIKDVKGEPMGLVAVFEDLSDIEKAQRMEAWNEVARRVAHEVKNPLTPIQLSTQRLVKRLAPKLEGKDKALLEECSHLILGQVEELKKLVDEFALFARMPRSVKSRCDIVALVMEVIEVFRERFKDMRFSLEVLGDVPEVLMDREQIRRVLMNIMDNGVQATGEKGEIRVSIHTHEPGVVTISISDNGIGISPKHMERVFEPYFSTKEEGAGLGLAISHMIVKEHLGEIRLSSIEGQGTTVTIELPGGKED